MALDLFIIGTSGLAKEAAQLARRIDPDAAIWSNIHYVTNDPSLLGQARPFGVVNALDDVLHNRRVPTDVAIGIGHPKIRRQVAASLRTNIHLRFPNLVHPRVELDSNFVRIGVGNMITQGVVLTCDIALGDFNLLNWNVTVGHDCRIGSYNVINPGSNVSGNVTLGDACLIGTGARILEGRHIADDVTLGAGAVLTKSVTTPGEVYIGIPARVKTS